MHYDEILKPLANYCKELGIKLSTRISAGVDD